MRPLAPPSPQVFVISASKVQQRGYDTLFK